MAWAYHITSRENLPGIVKRGLRPSAEALKGRKIYFMEDAGFYQEDIGYGDVLLRFPWPDDARQEPDYEWTTRRVVPACELEIWLGNNPDHVDYNGDFFLFCDVHLFRPRRAGREGWIFDAEKDLK